jgi:hypothetical protein
MGTKNNPGKFDCYAAAEPDEPMFVLLGRDAHASVLVEEWAKARMQAGEDVTKVSDAFTCARDMRAWCESLGKQPKLLAKPKWIVFVNEGKEGRYSELCYTDEEMEAAYIHAQDPDANVYPEEGEPSEFVRECLDFLRDDNQWEYAVDLARESFITEFEDGQIEIRRL